MIRCALVVDDSVIARVYMLDILQNIGIPTVIDAENGAECLEIVRNDPPDVIFLDIEMPGMNGVQVLKAIRQFNREVMVIMMTSIANPEVVRQCVANGTNHYILKDLPEEKITQRLRQILNIGGT